MKRICAILSILCLIVTSLGAHARYCLCANRDTDYHDCSSSGCHHKEISVQQPVSCCANTNTGDSRVRDVGSCAVNPPTGDGDFGNKKDCEPDCMYLLPPIIADGPNRLTYLEPDKIMTNTTLTQMVDIKAENTPKADIVLIKNIDPSVTSTVLRI